MAWYARDIPVLVGAAVTKSEPFGRREEAGLDGSFSALVRYSVLWPFHAPSTSAVHVRIRDATRGDPSAVNVADPGTERLAALGVPAADADRLARLARAQLVGDVNLDMLVGRNDRQIREILGCYRISRGVTDRFLIRRLHQPDVLQAEDPGARPRCSADLGSRRRRRRIRPALGAVPHIRGRPFCGHCPGT
ncbi:hypothetical protein AB0F91_46060 [Amycolatopsis sp. NPDC023774]|uniref:hypothetical protein n=1 Tax=Amycolatopsis sp. NPDC023774 TaxID=3155015 RepID=UPI0033C355B9